MTESDYTSSSISTGGAGPVFEHHVGAMVSWAPSHARDPRRTEGLSSRGG